MVNNYAIYGGFGLSGIPTAVIGNLGTACVYLPRCYNNAFRKSMIKACIDKGFKKVATHVFLEDPLIPYYVALIKSFYVPGNDDVMWVFSGYACYVYERSFGKGKYIYEINEDYSKIEVLNKIITESKTTPNVCFFYDDDNKFNKQVVAELFPFCKCHVLVSTLKGLMQKTNILLPWNWKMVCQFAHIKANEKERHNCDTYDVLTRNIDVKYDDQKIMEIKKFQSLPFKAIYKNEEEKRLGFFEKFISFKVPENLKNFYVFFKINENGIFSVKYLSSFVISITGEVVAIYNIQNDETIFFNATVDYGFEEPIVGVNYWSKTVISEPLNFFKRKCKNNKIHVKLFLMHDITEYVIEVHGTNKLVPTTNVVTDILKYAVNVHNINTNSCILTYPPHFTEQQKEMFIQTVKKSGFQDPAFVDEQISLAFGCEQKYDIQPDTLYIIVHYSNPKICISLFKAGTDFYKEHERILLEAEDIESSKNVFFDSIIKNEKSKRKDNVNEMLENCLLSMSNLLKNKNIQLVFVTRSPFLFAVIIDHFPETSINFIKSPGKIIAEGAIYGYDNFKEI